MILCQVLVHFPVVYCKIHRHPEAWKGISDISFRDWDCVRFLFNFLLSTVQTTQTLVNKNELLQMAHLIYQFRNETVSSKVSFSCYLLCSANSSYIVQQKVVPWKGMPGEPVFDWDCQVFGHLSFLHCANFLDIGQEKGVKWQDISDISNLEWHLSGICLISCCLLVKLFGHWAPRMIHFKWRIWYISFTVRLYQVRFHFLVFFCSANDWYIAQQKVVPWKDKTDQRVFEWDFQVFGHLFFPFLR